MENVSVVGFKGLRSDVKSAIRKSVSNIFGCRRVTVSIREPKRGAHGKKGLRLIGYAELEEVVKATYQSEEKGPSFVLQISGITKQQFAEINTRKEILVSSPDVTKKDVPVSIATKVEPKTSANLVAKVSATCRPVRKRSAPKVRTKDFTSLLAVYVLITEISKKGRVVQLSIAINAFRELHKVNSHRSSVMKIFGAISKYCTITDETFEITSHGLNYIKMVDRTTQLLGHRKISLVV